MQPDVLSSRLVYTLQSQCIAPTVMRYSNYDAANANCGTNANCIELEYSEVMLRAQTIALPRVSFLDCLDHDGNTIDGCSPEGILTEHLASELARIQVGNSQSAVEIDQAAGNLVRSCRLVSGQVCRQRDQFVRSDWRATAQTPAVTIGLWILALGTTLIIAGPFIWHVIRLVIRWVKG